MPRSKLLDRAKQFLPELAKAEAELNQRMESGENVDIEHCAGTSDTQFKWLEALQIVCAISCYLDFFINDKDDCKK